MTDVLEAAGLTPRKIHGYGWKPSLPDIRDHIADASGLPVLEEVDPRADLPGVFDQGQLGSCTANAVAGAVEYDAKLNGSDPGFLSRLWIYYYERKVEGSPADQDTGAYGRDGFKVCHKLGVHSGETTADGKITVEFAECLGICDYAPAALADDGRVFGPLDEEKVNAMLEDLKR